MRHLICFAIAIWWIAVVPETWAGLEFGQEAPTVVLKDKQGGRLDGSPWSSSECRGKVTVLFYVDPDAKDMNNAASDALLAENFPRETYQSCAIINMAATWMPNFAIASSLAEKQKKYPNTVYVRDNQKNLVHAWQIADDTSDVLVFDKSGKLLFRKFGQLNDAEIKVLVKVIRDHLDT